MYVFIFSTVVIGFASAGVVMLLFRLWGRKAPKYVIPLVAAIAMFGYMIWDEYTWFDRYEARLPQTISVIQTFTRPGHWFPHRPTALRRLIAKNWYPIPKTPMKNAS